MTATGKRRGPRPHSSDTAPTRAVPLFQAQPIRRSEGAESSFDTAVTLAYARAPAPGRRAKRSASRARASACVRGALLAAVIVAVGSTATYAALELVHGTFGLPLGLTRSGAVSPGSAAELLARRAYPEALAAYRSLAGAHPEQRHYAVIAELIEARRRPVVELPR